MADARPLLTRLRAENVRSFARLDLELGALTVLVGPNGAGKSNVVELLRFLRDASTSTMFEAISHQRGWSAFRRHHADSVRFGMILAEGDDRLDYDARVNDVGWTIMVHHEHIELEGSDTVGIYHDHKSSKVLPARRLGMDSRDNPDLALLRPGTLVPMTAADDSTFGNGSTSGVETARITSHLLRHVGGIRIYNPVSATLRDQPQRTDADPVLKEDLSNLGAILVAIRETLLGDQIDRALALLVDGVTGYTVLQAGSTLVPQILYGLGGARDLGLESDGTIRLVALLAALYQPVLPSLVVLEEPEMGLHPGVLSALAEFIEEASTRMQVLVTTHSPDLIDCFDLDVLRVVEKIDGESRVGPVRPQQREAIRKHLFQPSELMRMEGLQLDLG